MPAGSEVVFDIALDLTSTDPKTHYIQLELNNSGFDSVEDYDPFPKGQDPLPGNRGNHRLDWMAPGGVARLGALLLLTRGGGRRRSSAPF
ncbi:MAG: hypothetical protein CM1200mP32_03060 [Methanobacteriota archaeon]|nr:MAG: hypothetical protein CM1200mP32_03060 [Euryarchaeota archaeon]